MMVMSLHLGMCAPSTQPHNINATVNFIPVANTSPHYRPYTSSSFGPCLTQLTAIEVTFLHPVSHQ